MFQESMVFASFPRYDPRHLLGSQPPRDLDAKCVTQVSWNYNFILRFKRVNCLDLLTGAVREEIDMNILRKRLTSSSSTKTTGGLSASDSRMPEKTHFTENKLYMPGALMNVRRGCATPTGLRYYCPADNIRHRNECGSSSQDFFRGRTTFGTAKMNYQRQAGLSCLPACAVRLAAANR